jgi:hypothetical protein
MYDGGGIDDEKGSGVIFWSIEMAQIRAYFAAFIFSKLSQIRVFFKGIVSRDGVSTEAFGVRGVIKTKPEYACRFVSFVIQELQTKA